MKRLSRLPALVASLLSAQIVAAAAASANSVRTFGISGLFRDGAVMSGTVTVDEDTGRVIGCHVTVAGHRVLRFDRVEVQTVVGKAAVIQMAPENRNWPKLIIGEATFPGSVRGYQGGPLGPRTDILQRNHLNVRILSGHLLPMPQSPS
jgi:hypothetical protein